MDRNNLERIVRQLLEAIGEDADRPGLRDTPRRVAQFWIDVLEEDVSLPDSRTAPAAAAGELLAMRSQEFVSICEKHLLPFAGTAKVVCEAEGGQSELSNLSSIVATASSRLQRPQRLGQDIALECERAFYPRGVVVVIEARNLCCSESRFEQRSQNEVTVVRRGAFSTPAYHSELLSLLGIPPE